MLKKTAWATFAAKGLSETGKAILEQAQEIDFETGALKNWAERTHTESLKKQRKKQLKLLKGEERKEKLKEIRKQVRVERRKRNGEKLDRVRNECITFQQKPVSIQVCQVGLSFWA